MIDLGIVLFLLLTERIKVLVYRVGHKWDIYLIAH